MQNVLDEEEMSQEFDAVASKYMLALLGVYTYIHTYINIYMYIYMHTECIG